MSSSAKEGRGPDKEEKQSVYVAPFMVPLPPFDSAKRIDELRRILKEWWNHPISPTKNQEQNILKVISLYEEGYLPRSEVIWLSEGKIIAEADLGSYSHIWREGTFVQCLNGVKYGQAPGGTFGLNIMHMEVRLSRQHGGDGTSMQCQVVNDTGSTAQTVLQSDIQRLGNLEHFRGELGPNWVVMANGWAEEVSSLLIDVRLLDNEGHAFSN